MSLLEVLEFYGGLTLHLGARSSFIGFAMLLRRNTLLPCTYTVRQRTSDGTPEVSLLVRQTKLPGLELCDALLLTESINVLLPQLDVAQTTICKLTDSTVVLSWVQKPPCSWTTFVANRVSKIEELVGMNDWNHVDSYENPANLGIRKYIANLSKNTSGFQFIKTK